jgi:GTP-binding protein
MNLDPSLPIVSLAGRVNVGKSTLFNRLTGAMRALVHDRPGVTRDIRDGIVLSPHKHFLLRDTPGLTPSEHQELSQKILQHTLSSFKSCHLILFVFDGKVGPTPLDFSLARALISSTQSVILVANKTEGAIDPNLIYQSVKFGFGEPILCSAAHGLGIDELLLSIHKKLPQENLENTQNQQDENPPLELAIIGRPNVGKSTLTNKLLQDYRMITGPEPGITRDAISSLWFWNQNPFLLTDTAGVRKRAKTHDQVEKLAVTETLNSIKNAHIVALLLEPSGLLEKQDLLLASRISEAGVPIILIINKWDTVSKDLSASILSTLRERAKNAMPILGNPSIITLSASTGYNINALPKTALELHRKASTPLKTSELNQWLQNTIKKHSPPLTNQKKQIKLRYITQYKNNPITCIIFGHRTPEMPPAYLRYLSNSFQKHFNLQGIPIRWIFRQSQNQPPPPAP